MLTRPSGAFPQRGEASSPVSSADDSSECSSAGGASISTSSPEEEDSSTDASSAEWRATRCFVLAIEEEDEQVERRRIWRKASKLQVKREIFERRMSHPEGVLLINASLSRRLIQKSARLTQQAF